MRKYVYVIYDPLYEKVICVHEKQDVVCNKCKKIEKDKNRGNYFLEESKFLIRK